MIAQAKQLFIRLHVALRTNPYAYHRSATIRLDYGIKPLLVIMVSDFDPRVIAT